MSTYQMLQSFVASWGLAFFGLIFIVALAYALRPSNRGKFDKASRIPLQED